MREALERFVVVPTPPIEPGNYRTYVAFNVGALAACGIHLCILPLFWWLGATELLWLNLGSQLAYLGALVANRRGHHATMMAICLLELSVHQAACVHYLGWATGFQYYLLVYPAFALLLPGRRLALQLSLHAVAMGAFLGIYTWSLAHEPVHRIAPGVAAVVSYFNIVGLFTLLGLFGWNFRQAADAAEARLAVTERKLADDRLMLLKAAVAAAQDIIVITDERGDIEFVNRAFATATGHAESEVLGRNISLVYSGRHPPEFIDEMWQTLRAGRSWSGRFVNRRKSGELYTEAATITPIRDDAGAIRHYLSIKQDITEAERAEERLAETEEQLRQAKKMEAIGTLAGGIAHDFNNVLTVILGYAAALKETLPESDERLEDLEEIERAGERAAALTRQLLAYSRRQVLSPQLLDPNRVVREIERLLRRSVSERVELALRLSPSVRHVVADEAQLGQVLLNLAVNANDAMPNGGLLVVGTDGAALAEPTVLGQFTVPAGDYVVLSVSDTGEGIAPEAMARIFEPFFTTKAFGKGTGLGLATVYGIVAQSEGHLSVESRLGVGTTFKVFLPAREARAVESLPVQAPERPRGVETILLVEDDPAVRAVARRTLRSCGYRVVEASDGREAVDLLASSREHVELLVTDVMMPGIDGPSLAQELIGQYPDLAVIFMSGYPGEVIAKHGRFVPGENFLSKPFSADALAALVRKVLDS